MSIETKNRDWILMALVGTLALGSVLLHLPAAEAETQKWYRLTPEMRRMHGLSPEVESIALRRGTFVRGKGWQASWMVRIPERQKLFQPRTTLRKAWFIQYDSGRTEARFRDDAPRGAADVRRIVGMTQVVVQKMRAARRRP